MSKIPVSTFATRSGYSRQTIYDQFKCGGLLKDVKGGIDLSHPVNFRFLEDREIPMAIMLGVEPPIQRAATETAPRKPPVTAPPRPPTPPRKSPRGQEKPQQDYVQVSDEHIKVFENTDFENIDVRDLRTTDIANYQKFEKFLTDRMGREIKRRGLIERELVVKVMGRIHTIDSNEFKSFGARLTPEIASIAGLEDAEKILKIEQRIDDLVLESLQHIKRTVDDFLAGLEPEG